MIGGTFEIREIKNEDNYEDCDMGTRHLCSRSALLEICKIKNDNSYENLTLALVNWDSSEDPCPRQPPSL